MTVRIAMALCASLLAVQVAHADDQWTWAGPYAGATFGGNSLSTDFESGFGTLPDGRYDDGAASFGGVAGYGWATGPLYLGMEIDAQALSGATNRDGRVNGTISGVSAESSGHNVVTGVAVGSLGGPCIGNCKGGVGGAIGGPAEPVVLGKTGDSLEAFETRVDAVFSLRVRLGMPLGRFLPYVTAGLAAGQVNTRYLHLEEVRIRYSSGRIGTAVQGGYLDDSDLAFGYSIGAGTEVALTPRLSLRGEYLYSDLGKLKIEMADGSTTLAARVHQGRLGLIWRF
jgi:outer membrane immunogenic protein